MTRLLTRSLYVPVVLPVVEICGAENVLVQTNGLKARMFCYAADVCSRPLLSWRTLWAAHGSTQSPLLFASAHTSHKNTYNATDKGKSVGNNHRTSQSVNVEC